MPEPRSLLAPSGCRSAITTLESLGQIFARHRGDRKILFELETAPPNRLRVRVDVSSQIRVRPSSALISEVEELVGAGAVELR